MRYSVCKFCKKHNPKLFGLNSKITCYDDYCINGSAFEPVDVAPKTDNEEGINMSNFSSLENLMRSAKIQAEIKKDPIKALQVYANLQIISNKLINNKLLDRYMDNFDKYDFDQILSSTTIAVALIKDMEKTLSEVSPKDFDASSEIVDGLYSVLYTLLGDLSNASKESDEDIDNKR